MLFSNMKQDVIIGIDFKSKISGGSFMIVRFENERTRIIVRPLHSYYDVILEDFKLETLRILGEMVFLFRIV